MLLLLMLCSSLQVTQRWFLELPVEVVAEERARRERFTGVEGTRALQSVQFRGQLYALFARALSCFCAHCRASIRSAAPITGMCSNVKYVKAWRQHDLVTKRDADAEAVLLVSNYRWIQCVS
jgi:hypothetical protein